MLKIVVGPFIWLIYACIAFLCITAFAFIGVIVIPVVAGIWLIASIMDWIELREKRYK